jgi:hypothetical protein
MDPTRIADGLLFHVRILEDRFDGLHRLPEVSSSNFKFGAGQGFGKFVAVLETFDLDASSLLAGKSSSEIF